MKTKKLIGIVGIAFLTILVAGFSWIWFAPCALGGCVPLDDLARFEAEGSELLDVNGEVFAHLATVNRRIVPLDSLPAHLPQAFLAIEDRRFYSHHGVDLWRTAGAMWQNVRSGGVEEGGSSITQQLARNLFPEWLPYRERNLRRKILEARVARQIERNFTKDKILELYLNHIYLGNGAYGVEAAAQTYFAKSAADLDLAEAATLAALPQAPSRVNPRQDVEGTTTRRNLVLDEMVEAGFVGSEEATAAKEEPIHVREGGQGEDGPTSAYFVELVRRELEEVVGSRFYTAGLKIHTTLDRVVQAAAETELENQLRAIESGRYGLFRHSTFAAASDASDRVEYLQGAVVVLDVNTGEVRGLVGGRDFGHSKFDRSTQALRQPGSAFKPFVFASALEYFRSPTHQVEDSPLRVTLAGGRVWEPRNYADSYGGRVTLREALVHSRNTATVRLTQEIGLRPAIELARSLGINSELPDLPSTALGAAEVRPIELVAAYAAFANGGARVQPYLIRRVEDRYGQVLWESHPRRQQILDPAVAFVLTTMLEDAVDRGTGAAVRATGFRAPAAGKTGTTNNSTDAWFVGYTPELAAGIWIGFDDPKPIVRGASGGTLAAPTWGRMMRRIYEDRPTPADWSPPSGVVVAEVDRATGGTVNPNCPVLGQVYSEYFIRYTPPAQACWDYDLPYAYYDSLGWDHSWDEFGVYESSDDSLLAEGIDWPELEELRRRSREIREGRAAAASETSAAMDSLRNRILGDEREAVGPSGAVPPQGAGAAAGANEVGRPQPQQPDPQGTPPGSQAGPPAEGGGTPPARPADGSEDAAPDDDQGDADSAGPPEVEPSIQ